MVKVTGFQLASAMIRLSNRRRWSFRSLGRLGPYSLILAKSELTSPEDLQEIGLIQEATDKIHELEPNVYSDDQALRSTENQILKAVELLPSLSNLDRNPLDKAMDEEAQDVFK